MEYHSMLNRTELSGHKKGWKTRKCMLLKWRRRQGKGLKIYTKSKCRPLDATVLNLEIYELKHTGWLTPTHLHTRWIPSLYGINSVPTPRVQFIRSWECFSWHPSCNSRKIKQASKAPWHSTSFFHSTLFTWEFALVVLFTATWRDRTKCIW